MRCRIAHLTSHVHGCWMCDPTSYPHMIRHIRICDVLSWMSYCASFDLYQWSQITDLKIQILMLDHVALGKKIHDVGRCWISHLTSCVHGCEMCDPTSYPTYDSTYLDLWCAIVDVISCIIHHVSAILHLVSPRSHDSKSRCRSLDKRSVIVDVGCMIIDVRSRWEHFWT